MKLKVSFEKGVRAYLVKEGDGYRVKFTLSKDARYKGIFFKEIGTDFNNGIFKFMSNHKMCQVHITDDFVADPSFIKDKSRKSINDQIKHRNK